MCPDHGLPGNQEIAFRRAEMGDFAGSSCQGWSRDRKNRRKPLCRQGKTSFSGGAAIVLGLFLTLTPGFGGPSRALAVSDQDYNSDPEGPRGPYHDSPVNPALNHLDVHVPDGGGSGLPVMVYVHGGGWATGTKEHTAYKDELFTGDGYVFVSLNYRLSPDPGDLEAGNRVMFPDHPQDVAEAIRYVYDNVHLAGGDNRQIFLIGHSAGAHLVALVGTDPTYLNAFGLSMDVIKGVCPLDTAAYDIPARLAYSWSTLFYNAFGTPEENDLTGSWAAASPALHADPTDPPFFLVAQEGGGEHRIWQNENMVSSLGRDPSRFVITVPRTHAEINQELGAPYDPAHITEAVMGFFDYVITGAPCSDADGDGYGDPASPACDGAKWDCNDGEPAVSPGVGEDCGNGLDDDCDGFSDGADTECGGPAWGAAAPVEASAPGLHESRATSRSFNVLNAIFLPVLAVLVLRIMGRGWSGRGRGRVGRRF
jgi:acetyl esterase/lipase